MEKPFHFVIFDVKVRYREDVATIGPAGGELESQMEQGIRVEVRSRTFDQPAKMKLKVGQGHLEYCSHNIRNTSNLICVFT